VVVDQSRRWAAGEVEELSRKQMVSAKLRAAGLKATSPVASLSALPPAELRLAPG
jgi:hypothetical protein